MINSRFTGWAFFTASLTVLVILVVIFLTVSQSGFFSYDSPLLFNILFSIFFFHIFSLLIFGELRNKVVKVHIYENEIIKRGFCGFGYKKRFLFDEIDGYKFSHISSKNGTYEYFYIMRRGIKVIKLSEFYHSNYKELKLAIIKKGVNNLGIEEWSLLRETKEIYSQII